MEVAGGIVHLPDPLPPFEQAGERLLREVLGLALAPRDDGKDTEQALLLVLEERLEARRPAVGKHRLFGSLPPPMHASHLAHVDRFNRRRRPNL